ncbi:MAG: hypothetical protein KA210_14940 [Bacteroidia bacterium]|jgi:hypothetical protein|nr:hypothetical protein [Bacteroidia bacterium]
MKKYSLIIFVFICLSLLSFDLDAQCAMCKEVVNSSQDNPNSIAKNLNTGILYLMAVPYLMIAFIFRKQIRSLYRTLRGKEVQEEDL